LELYRLKFSEIARFDVEDVDDYNINGTFNPNASSDVEFYGFRETTFKVTSVENRTITGKWVPFNDDEVKFFANYYDDTLTLIVQDAIDKQNGEY
jgi:hypothetical protein